MTPGHAASTSSTDSQPSAGPRHPCQEPILLKHPGSGHPGLPLLATRIPFRSSPTRNVQGGVWICTLRLGLKRPRPCVPLLHSHLPLFLASLSLPLLSSLSLFFTRLQLTSLRYLILFEIVFDQAFSCHSFSTSVPFALLGCANDHHKQQIHRLASFARQDPSPYQVESIFTLLTPIHLLESSA